MTRYNYIKGKSIIHIIDGKDIIRHMSHFKNMSVECQHCNNIERKSISMKETKLTFDYFGNSDERPLVWGSAKGEFLASAGLEPYWSDKYNEHLRKSGEKHSIENLLSFSHEHGAKVTGRVITPDKAHEIAFVGIQFSEIYTNPKKAINILADAIERSFKDQGYDAKLSRKYAKKETAFGKALYIKKHTE